MTKCCRTSCWEQSSAAAARVGGTVHKDLWQRALVQVLAPTRAPVPWQPLAALLSHSEGATCFLTFLLDIHHLITMKVRGLWSLPRKSWNQTIHPKHCNKTPQKVINIFTPPALPVHNAKWVFQKMNLSSESPWQLAVREGEVFTSRSQLRRYNSEIGRNRQFCQWLINKNACPQNHYPASRQEWVWSNRKSNPKSLSHVLSQRTFWACCKVSIPVLDDTKGKKNPFGFQKEKWKIKSCWSSKCWGRFTEWALTLFNCRCGCLQGTGSQKSVQISLWQPSSTVMT